MVVVVVVVVVVCRLRVSDLLGDGDVVDVDDVDDGGDGDDRVVDLFCSFNCARSSGGGFRRGCNIIFCFGAGGVVDVVDGGVVDGDGL